jgi:hypothetical protein
LSKNSIGCLAGWCSAEFTIGDWISPGYGDGICIGVPEPDGQDVDCDDYEAVFAGIIFFQEYLIYFSDN